MPPSSPARLHLPAALIALACAAAIPAQDVAQEAAPSPIEWLDSLERGLQLARTERKPLFVTLRCLPCKQCANFDRDVHEGGPELDPLLRRFVTVRLTNAADLDLRRMPVSEFQDLGVDGHGPDLAGRAFLVWFRLRKDPGDEVRLRVHDGGREREVVYRLASRDE